MLKVPEKLHDNRIIHRDLKPANTTIGQGSYTNKVHLIDFGLADFYADHNHRHVEMDETNKFYGTMRFASINAHKLC